MLYDRDYKILTDEEKLIWQKAHLNIDELKNKDQLKKIIGEFALLLDNSPI